MVLHPFDIQVLFEKLAISPFPNEVLVWWSCGCWFEAFLIIRLRLGAGAASFAPAGGTCCSRRKSLFVRYYNHLTANGCSLDIQFLFHSTFELQSRFPITIFMTFYCRSQCTLIGQWKLKFLKWMEIGWNVTLHSSFQPVFKLESSSAVHWITTDNRAKSPSGSFQ